MGREGAGKVNFTRAVIAGTLERVGLINCGPFLICLARRRDYREIFKPIYTYGKEKRKLSVNWRYFVEMRRGNLRRIYFARGGKKKKNSRDDKARVRRSRLSELAEKCTSFALSELSELLASCFSCVYIFYTRTYLHERDLWRVSSWKKRSPQHSLPPESRPSSEEEETLESFWKRACKMGRKINCLRSELSYSLCYGTWALSRGKIHGAW